MIKEAYDAGFTYGITLAEQLLKQAQDYQDYYAATPRNYDEYWTNLARMYGLTPEQLYLAATKQVVPAEQYYSPEAYYIAANTGPLGTASTAPAPEQLYGATSDYYPYYY